MITYEYNGVKLPPLKRITGHNYALICSVTGELFYNYVLMLVSKPYKVLNGKICFDTAGSYQVYFSGKNSTEWREGSLIITDEGASTTYASIDKDATFLWCNENITDYYNASEIKYVGTQPVEIPSAAKPVIINNLPNSKYYNQNDENIEPLEVKVSASDTDEGAVLSYQWYCDGKKIEGATSNSYTPPVDQMGEWKYQCKIINTYQEYTAFVNSNVVLVTVVQALKPINEEFLLGWKIGRIMAMLRGEIKPTVPESAMHLYGTPSATGNIGLRSGESVTLYDGAVLPPLPEWDKTVYPYAVITEYTANADIHILVVSQNPMTVSDSGHLIGGVGIKYIIGGELYGDDEWYKSPNTMLPYEKKRLWANYDVYNANNSIVLAKSDPIPVTGIVGYSYNGTVLPELPVEWDRDEYPYAIIYKDIGSNKECLFVAKVPSTLYDNSGNGNYTFSANGWGDSNPIKFENDGTNWIEGFLFPQHIYASTYIWSNYDIIDNQGIAGAVDSVYCEGTDPIPVYDKE